MDTGQKLIHPRGIRTMSATLTMLQNPRIVSGSRDISFCAGIFKIKQRRSRFWHNSDRVGRYDTCITTS